MTTMAKAPKRGGTVERWTFRTKEIRDALHAVMPATEARHAVRQCVRIGNGAIEATTGELRIIVDLPAATGLPILIPAQRLQSILREGAEEVQLEPRGTSVHITSGRGTWTIPISDSPEWPEMSPVDEVAFVRLPADQFCRMARTTIAAIDTESSRYALGGVCIEKKGDDVSFIGTDGRRLHVAVADVDQATDDAAVVVPGSALAAVAKSAEVDSESSVQMMRAGADVVFQIRGENRPDVTIFARLLEGRYPRWRDVIPKWVSDTTPTVVSTTWLTAATKSASICASDASRGVTFAISPSGMLLTSRSAEYGEAAVTCEIVSCGVATAVKLDPGFLTAFLSTLRDALAVEMFVLEPESAVVIRHDDTTCVIMPLAAG